MSEFDLYRAPGHLLRRMQQIAVALFAEETRDHGLTPVQFAILVALESHPGLEQVALAERIGFDAATIGGVLARLEERGHVARVQGTADRRAKLIFPTPQGRRTMQAMTAAVERAQARILAPLDPAERETFMRLLHRLVLENNELSRAPLRMREPG